MSQKAGIGARILIILYGAALVALGMYPIQREYGSMSAFLKRQFAAVMPNGSLEDLKVKRPLPTGAEKRKLKAARARLIDPDDQKEMDRLTQSDRLQLDNLLSSFDK